MPREFKVGDIVTRSGVIGVVVSTTNPCNYYQIAVDFEGGAKNTFTKDGRFLDDGPQVLFHKYEEPEEVEIICFDGVINGGDESIKAQIEHALAQNSGRIVMVTLPDGQSYMCAKIQN